MIARLLISTICIVLLLWGCDHSTAVPAKPIVVRKKIVAPKKQTVNVSTQKTVRQAKARPIAKRQTKTVTNKNDNNGAVAKVVRKKIVAPKKQTVDVSTQKTVRQAKARPVTKQQTKTVTQKINNIGTAAEKQQVATKKSESRKPTAKQDKTASATSKLNGQLTAKKPAISPKSEITVIKPIVQQQKQAGDGSSVTIKKSEPVKPMIAATNIRPGGIPALYNPAGKIDPFEPLFREKAVMAKKKKKIKRQPQTPLERIDLSQLKLVGIILAASGNRALVEESSGKGYVVKTGTYIGINGGKIVEIDKELVTVEEQFEDVFGKIQTQKRKLKLPKPPGEF